MRNRIEKLAKLSLLFASRQFSVKVGDHILTCRSPISNDGFVDQDYTIISVSGFELCDLWVFKGSVDIDAAIRDFGLFRVTTAQIDALELIYKKVALMQIFHPATGFKNALKIIQICFRFQK